MFFLNLTAAEFLGLFGVLSGLVTALYLLDRTRRKKVVSTLRFWNPAFSAEQQQSRKRVREPWSLILQLVSLLLLLLAIAQLEWGTREARGQDHVVLLDTSSWTAQTGTAAEAGAKETVLAREKTAAEQYLAALPTRDRVMLVRADALSAPATPFTTDRQQVLRAIRESTPAFSALNIGQALSFASQARSWSGGQEGEIVYVGPKLVENTAAGSDAMALKLPNLRVIDIPASHDNAGIRSIAVKRGEDEGNSWQAAITLKNYAANPRVVSLHTQFAGTVFTPRSVSLRPGQETTVQYDFVTNTSGRFTASIEPHDSLPADDQGSLELPASGLLRVVAFTDRPQVLRPLLTANRQLAVKFESAGSYSSKPAADVVVLDEFAPAAGQQNKQPKLPSLWIDPPRQDCPLPIKAVVTNATIKSWQSGDALDAGLHAKESQIPRAEVFETFQSDQAVADIAEGPVVVARDGRGSSPKMAVIGFDPLSGPLRFEVTTPLLFANLLRWLSPEAFRTLEIAAGRVGTSTVNLDKNENASSLHVTDERGFAVPFTVRDQMLELFVSRPGVVRILSADRDRVLSLTLPDVAEVEWKPTEVSTGLPAARSFGPTSTDLWRWLAVLGGLGLLAEWLLFGRRRLLNWQRSAAPATRPAPVPERELVSK